MGTWKLNESKSKFGDGSAKNHTVIYAAAGESVKVTVDGTDADGKSTHNEWTGKFDGKDYPVTGDPSSDMRSYKKVDDRTLELSVKKAGKVTATGGLSSLPMARAAPSTRAGLIRKAKQLRTPPSTTKSNRCSHRRRLCLGLFGPQNDGA